jgi:uncharacterized membrane protein (DUF4010 family)
MALLYVVVLFVVAIVKTTLGNQALYWVAVLSGLTDVDAITLSLAHLVLTENLAVDEAWRLILTAILANLIFKLGMVGFLGNRQLLAHVALLFTPPLLGGILLIWLWPAGTTLF